MTREAIKIYVLDSLAGRLTCKEFVEMVTDYLDGTMTIGKRIRFHWHLGMCLGCRIYIRQMKQTIRAMGQLPQEPAPPSIREELVRRFRNLKT